MINRSFIYDALYRLVQAEGREHVGQGQPIADDFIPRAAPDDPTGLRGYMETYAFDLVGNILQMQHQAPGANWTRHYQYAASGNRLLATSAPGDGPGVFSHAFAYDAHGSMTAMPHLAQVDWDHADRIQSADLGGGGTVWFLYDSVGNRVRKIRVNQAGTSTYERIYLGGYECYRERVGTEFQLERQTLHIADDTGRICLVETKTIDDANVVPLPANISRYQYGNHLGSVGMELDETGQLISYEELHPYGSTAYRAANSAVDVSPSRYRYTGKERDEETGLGYHGVRYYASWLGRWTAADPIGLGDGCNRYSYVGGRPTVVHDPTGAKGTGNNELRSEIVSLLKTGQVTGIGAPVAGTIKDEQVKRNLAIEAGDEATVFAEADRQLYQEELAANETNRADNRELRKTLRQERRLARRANDDILASNKEQELQAAKARRRELVQEKRILRGERDTRGHEVEWNITLLEAPDSLLYTTPIPGGPETSERDTHGQEHLVSSSGQATRDELRTAGLPDRGIVGKLHSHPISDLENPRADQREQSFAPSETDIQRAQGAKSVSHFIVDPGGGIIEYDGNGTLSEIRPSTPGKTAVDAARERLGAEAFNARVLGAKSVLKAIDRRALARAQSGR